MGEESGDLDLEAIRAKRRKALVEKWGAGKSLSGSEEEEIRDLVPEIDKKLKAEAAEAKRAEREERKEEVDSWPYLETAEDYVGKIPGVGSVRTLRRWVSLGRDAITPEFPEGDLPPLDEPWNLADWWSRNMTQKTPSALLELSTTNPADREPAEAPTSSEFAPPEDSGDYASALAGVRWEASAALRALKEAERAQPYSPPRVKMAAQRYDDAIARRREWERDSTRILREQGAVVDRVEAERLIGTAHTSIVSALRSGAVRIFQDLVAKSAPTVKISLEHAAELIREVGDGEEVEIPLPAPLELEVFAALFNEFIDDVCRALIEERFSLLPPDWDPTNGFAEPEASETESAAQS